MYVQRGVAGYDECLEYAPLLKVMTRQDADDLFTAMFLLDVRCSFLPPTPAGYDKDIDDLTQFILCNPDDSRGYYYRALTFAERPKEDDTVVDFDRAIADYSEAIQLDPQFARAYHNRGNAYLKKGDRAKAESDIAEANRLDPTYGDYWRGLRDKPDSWWAALHQKMFGPATGEESSPPKKPPPSPTSGGPRR
ncbi:MAG: tetratricopeptide repeat protein [Planctomycetia bacterium]|nr:tetratricopeptide repeat protein [Planctomycetia bacterium]